MSSLGVYILPIPHTGSIWECSKKKKNTFVLLPPVSVTLYGLDSSPYYVFIHIYTSLILFFFSPHVASNSNCNPCSKKYVMLCAACGGLAIILGSLFAVLYVVLRSYTSSLHYFETVPSYVASVSVNIEKDKPMNLTFTS